MKKKVVKITLIVLLLSIFIYDTYQVQFVKKHKKDDNTLSVEYENAGNLLLRDIHEGNTTSLKITVKNNSDSAKSFLFSFDEVVNNTLNTSEIYYFITRDDGNVLLFSGEYPKSNVVLDVGDNIEGHETVNYVVSVSALKLDEKDINKNIQSRIKLIV